MPIDSHVKFGIGWQDDECCSITSIECECGYKKDGDYTNPVIDLVSHEEVWTCPRCGYQIEFLWYGMGWRKYIPKTNHMDLGDLVRK